MASLTENIGKSVLKRRKKSMRRNVRVHNFETARSAVLLADGDDSSSFPVVKECVKFLKEQQIYTRVFVYVRQKEIPQELLFWKDYSFITRKDLNWIKKPVGVVAEQFFSINADILMDFTQNHPLEIQYLVQLSNASFKVGCFTEEDNDYDLMINMNGPCEQAFLYEQFRHYISLLNPVST